LHPSLDRKYRQTEEAVMVEDLALTLLQSLTVLAVSLNLSPPTWLCLYQQRSPNLHPALERKKRHLRNFGARNELLFRRDGTEIASFKCLSISSFKCLNTAASVSSPLVALLALSFAELDWDLESRELGFGNSSLSNAVSPRGPTTGSTSGHEKRVAGVTGSSESTDSVSAFSLHSTTSSSFFHATVLFSCCMFMRGM
jgi:hypothetical protein